MLASVSTEARELELSVDNRIGGNDNIFVRANDSNASKVEDGFWEISPQLKLRDQQDEFEYDFRYRPSYETYFETSGVDGWDQSARGSLDWRPTPTNAAGINADFSSTRRLRQVFEGVPTDPDLALEATDRQRLRRERGSVYYQHFFDPRFSGRVSYAYDDLDYSRRDVSDTTAHTASTGLNYSVGALTSIGTSVSFRQRFSRVNQSSGFPLNRIREVRSASRTVDVSFSIARQITPTIDVAVQAGPSFIDTRQEAQPLLVGGLTAIAGSKSKSSDVSFFAAASASKKWRLGAAELAYSRYESGGGGVVSTTIVDDVSLSVDHRPGRDWWLTGFVGWNQRKEIADSIAVGGSADVTRYRVAGSVSRVINSNLNVTARIEYRIQEQKRADDPSRRNIDVETLQGWIGIEYTWEPYVF